MIPLLDLSKLHAEHPGMQEVVDDAVLRVARSGRYVLGPEVEAFEEAWARYCGTRYCVGTANCLEALQLCLMAWGIGPGDEVIVPGNTYIATWLAAAHVHAKIVPVEPDTQTYNLTAWQVERAITRRTAAVIAVHLYGLPAEMQDLRYLCERKGIYLLEDAAQSHGATCGPRRTGNLGDAAAWSFYPSKNLGALGDAGAVTCNDPALDAKLRRMRNYGGVGRLDHTMLGINSRLDEMQAAVLRAKLPFLNEINARRQERAAVYTDMFRGRLELITPVCPADRTHVFHQYVLRTPLYMRDELVVNLAQRGIEAHIHYPVPPHKEKVFEGGNWNLPTSELLGSTVLSLPIGNKVDPEYVGKRVWEAVQQIQEEAA